MKSNDILKLYSVLSNKRDSFRLDPMKVASDEANKLHLELSNEEISLISETLITILSSLNEQAAFQIEQTKNRIDASIRKMKNTFSLMLVMHNVMFLIGIFLLVYSVVSMFRGIETTSLLLGGFGVVDLFYLLIRGPVQGINKDIGNLMQLRTAYHSYFEQINHWGGSYEYHSTIEWIPKKEEAADIIHNYTKQTLELIQKYCEPKKRND